MDSYGFSPRAPTSAHAKIIVQNNATFQDAIQFDPPPGLTGITGGTGPYWTLDNKTFRMDIKPNNELPALLSITSGAGQIVVDSTSLRVIHFNVPEATLTAAGLVPGKYWYDLIMIDTSVVPNLRIPMMHGVFEVTDGVTGG